ncbi:glycine-rich cell wall structural protein 1.8-like [Xenia sp. Carnegie-2017]|uniref:glycine-rich cell wall structural protein 1.8-like n=1 Tax=Xenia sp. Carnegie-2017 TaxID=2897299 RepID=UPI001F04C43A|nr:glycine-rich cell wall structural protein 1.8-like [Xenia sp. Carnegie-2017]
MAKFNFGFFFTLVFFYAAIQGSQGLCCNKIKTLVESKMDAYKVLCTNNTSLSLECCDDIKKEVKSYERAYESLCTNKTYRFRPFNANFTNLGATGRQGPTSIGQHYNGQDHVNMVRVLKGIQYWTVPYTGTYEITAVGAQGGYDRYGSTYRGRGAYMKGDFGLKKGEVLKILVGQKAPANTQSQTAGGGGGSFVARNNNVPLLVAGGGGGLENLKKRLENCDASIKTSGKNNKCVTPCGNWAGGVNGQGAKQADTGNSGGGGGGFYSNGRSSKRFGGKYGNGGEGGFAFINGGTGGRALYNNAVGGFGGGGGAYGAGGGAGGGGGYSGGASGDNVNGSCGGGGGSYNAGKNQVNKSAFNDKGHGYVVITRKG